MSAGVTGQSKIASHLALDFEQRQRASELEDFVTDDVYATAAEIIWLRDTNTALLALARKYASECASCGGTARDPWNSPNGKPCDVCADIRAVIVLAVLP